MTFIEAIQKEYAECAKILHYMVSSGPPPADMGDEARREYRRRLSTLRQRVTGLKRMLYQLGVGDLC